MKQTQRGFTLIELTMVIVILGILAAVAIPKFVDLSGNAATAATQGVAGALASASATNYAARSASSTYGASVADCSQVPSLLQGGSLPSGYTVTAGVAATSGTACTLTGQKSTTATFTAIAIS